MAVIWFSSGFKWAAFGYYSFANCLSLETYCVRLVFAVLSVQVGMIVLSIYFNTVHPVLICHVFAGLIFAEVRRAWYAASRWGKRMGDSIAAAEARDGALSLRCPAGKEPPVLRGASQPTWAVSVAGVLKTVGGQSGWTSRNRERTVEGKEPRQRVRRERAKTREQDNAAHPCRAKWRHPGQNPGVFIGSPPKQTLIQESVCRQFIFEVIPRSAARKARCQGRRSSREWLMSRLTAVCSSHHRLSRRMCGTHLRTVPLGGREAEVLTYQLWSLAQ